MPTETLRPSAAGDAAGLTPSGAAANWDCVDEASADDETTYVRTNGLVSDVADYYNLGASGLTSETIGSIDVQARVTTSDGTPDANSNSQIGVRLAGTNSLGTKISVFDIGAGNNVWVTYEESALARPGGGAWTVADLADLQVAVLLSEGSAGPNVRCTQIFVEVNYTPGRGGGGGGSKGGGGG